MVDQVVEGCERKPFGYMSCLSAIQDKYLVTPCNFCLKPASLLMMERYELWPHIDVLPMIKKVSSDGMPLAVAEYGIMLIENGKTEVEPIVHSPDSENSQVIKYADFESVYDAGWRVD